MHVRSNFTYGANFKKSQCNLMCWNYLYVMFRTQSKTFCGPHMIISGCDCWGEPTEPEALVIHSSQNSGKCQEQHLRTFTFSHTTPPEMFREKIKTCTKKDMFKNTVNISDNQQWSFQIGFVLQLLLQLLWRWRLSASGSMWFQSRGSIKGSEKSWGRNLTKWAGGQALYFLPQGKRSSTL